MYNRDNEIALTALTKHITHVNLFCSIALWVTALIGNTNDVRRQGRNNASINRTIRDVWVTTDVERRCTTRSFIIAAHEYYSIIVRNIFHEVLSSSTKSEQNPTI